MLAYSPFFMSGLSTPHHLTPQAHDLGPRRGSLPGISDEPPLDDASSTFYLNLQPRRDSTELLSFLSLDLADSQSSRSASLRRLTASSNAHSSSSKKFERALLHKPPLKRSSPLAGPSLDAEPSRSKLVQRPISPLAAKPLRSRKSGESVRSIPSPKPAPSTSLPDVPVQAPSSPAKVPPMKFTKNDLPPKLPALNLSPSLSSSIPISISIPMSTHRRPSRSVPSFSAAQLPHLVRRHSQSSASVSPSCKKVNRSDALACLEGRSSAVNRIRPDGSDTDVRPSPRDFLDMSYEGELVSGSKSKSKKSKGRGGYMHVKVPSSFKRALQDDLMADNDIPPLPSKHSHPKPTSSLILPPPSPTDLKPSIQRPSKMSMDGWIPLVSFIDFREDDARSRSRSGVRSVSMGWRSFIEISGTS